MVGINIFGIVFILPLFRNRGFRLSEAVSHAKQIKLSLDVFAMDHDGVYPNTDTTKLYGLPTPKSSNDLFQQLFASGSTNSERIFWAKNSRTCNPTKPDDVTTTGSKFDPSQTLLPGDNHWAYITGLTYPDLTDQADTEQFNRPLIVDSYLPGTTSFDRKLRNNRVIVTRIDGSVRAEPLSPTGTILDAKGKNLLTSGSALWSGLTPSLYQPVPPKP